MRDPVLVAPRQVTQVERHRSDDRIIAQDLHQAIVAAGVERDAIPQSAHVEPSRRGIQGLFLHVEGVDPALGAHTLRKQNGVVSPPTGRIDQDVTGTDGLAEDLMHKLGRSQKSGGHLRR